MERPRKKRGKLRRLFSLKNEYDGYNWGRIIVPLVILALVILVFFATMFYTVGVGQSVLIVDPLRGGDRISGPVTGPTWAIKMPWQSAVIIYTATDNLGMWGDGTDEYADFPAIPCFSRDQLEMDIDVLVRWQLDEGKLKDLYRTYPQKNWKDTTIASVIREQIRITTSKYSAIETIENRDLVRLAIYDAIKAKFDTEPSLNGVVINMEFELRDIGYPERYTQAIEEKLATEQAKIQAEYEAQKIIILAQADASQILIRAQANADAKIIESQGLWEAIDTLGANSNMSKAELTALYITLQTLKDMAASNGNTYFFIGFDEGVPFIIPIGPPVEP